MRVSIIVPTLDESREIGVALASLQASRRAGHEVIVVDGGSSDGTPALAEPLADRVITARRGRATQMNAGAAVARGDVLLFLHADSRLSASGVDAIVHRLPRSGRRWGRFDIAIAGRSRVLRNVARMMNLRSRMTGIVTGDQGLFVERELFAAIGRFAELPLMEDIALAARLKRAAGRPLCLKETVTTSDRRWAANGPWRTIVTMWRLRFDYWRGVQPAQLAERYGRLKDRASTRSLPTLQIFAKPPIAGTVKTRLAQAIGGVRAARIHEELVEQTLTMAASARSSGIVGRVELWCAPPFEHRAFAAWRDRFDVELERQHGNDLGSRMRHALHTSLTRGTPAVLIGSDCPVLDCDYLSRATAALDANAAVFGPAEDGGYVLVGLSRRVDVFDGIAWGTQDVMAATRARLMSGNIQWQELPTLWDVDTNDDLERWRRYAPRTAAVAV